MRPLLSQPTAFGAAADSFLAALERSGRSPLTVSRRVSALRHAAAFFAAAGVDSPAGLTAELFDRYGAALREAGWKEASVDSNLRSLRLLTRHLAAGGALFEDPLAGIRLRRPRVPAVRILSAADLHRLLTVPDTATCVGLRDRAMLETFYATAMRRNELRTLTLADLTLDTATVRVRGKGGAERLLPLGEHARHWLGAYLQRAWPVLRARSAAARPRGRRPASPAADPAPAAEPLWLTLDGRRLSNGLIDSTVRRLARQAGLAGGATPHTLRRTCATHLLAGGASPMAVANLLGHSDLRSLSHYLRVPYADLAATHQRTPPGQ